MKIVTIVGARPQFIKASMVSKALKKNGKVSEIIVHTGQHFDWNMSNVFFEQLQISKPDYMLNINSSNHGDMTGRMLVKIEKVLLREEPDWVLVYGDTNSTLAGALAASKLHIKVAHVEAGLRSFNMKMPEEINRILTDRVSVKLFCPTETAKENLLKEGYSSFDCDIIVTGDVMYDSVLHFSKVETYNPTVQKIIQAKEPFVLSTIHRAENTDDLRRLQSIFNALDEIVANRIKVVMPLHPRTRMLLKQYKLKAKVELIDPVDYIGMLKLLKHCILMVTDSGGLQKEAYFFNKYCITVREETEWTELIENGYNFLVGADCVGITQAYKRYSLLGDIKGKVDLYGCGDASVKIANHLL